MYKCNCCGECFSEPGEKLEKGGTCDVPFGYGSCNEPDYWVGVCPNCECEDFSKLEFDGEHCPYCDTPIDWKEINSLLKRLALNKVDKDNFGYDCPHCKITIVVMNGELQDEL